MKVQEQLKSDLLQFPILVKNKWSAYNQWFCIGNDNGMKWENGELVDSFSKRVLTTPKEGIDNAFNLFRESLNNNCSLINFPYDLDNLQKKVELITYIDGRMNDFTQSEELYDITAESPICNLPVDITQDWQDAVDEFVSWLCNNKEQLSETSKALLKERLYLEEL